MPSLPGVLDLQPVPADDPLLVERVGDRKPVP